MYLELFLALSSYSALPHTRRLICFLTIEFSFAFRLIDDFHYPHLYCASARTGPLYFIPCGKAEEGAANRCENGNFFASPIDIFRVDQSQTEVFARCIDAETDG